MLSSPPTSDAEWKALLASRNAEPPAFEVTRQAATERPFTGRYAQWRADGSYHCICCDARLFDAHDKFDAGCGWPSYTQPVQAEALDTREDRSLWMTRTEVLCAGCGAHLGHVFDDGPEPTGLRYCINSAALHFEPR